MSIYNLFSKRQKQLRGDVPDVFTYSRIPDPLKVQIVHIVNDALGNFASGGKVRDAYNTIVTTLCREYGVFRLPNTRDYDNNYAQLVHFFLNESDIEKCIDVIELTFTVIDHVTRDYYYQYHSDASSRADAAIAELNERFLEHGIGYKYVEKKIIRIDSEFTHAEIVKPVLKLLQAKEYKGAQEEFLKAHEHYRHGNTKEALNECLKSFESVIKVICDKKKWSYAPGATSKALIQICFEKGLIPPFWQDHYNSLRNSLESGVPTGRNKLGGHGQGSDQIVVPDFLVEYMLNMTASAILFLVKAETVK